MSSRTKGKPKTRAGAVFAAVIALVGALTNTRPAVAGAASMSTVVTCEALAGTRIPAAVLSLPTNGGLVESASRVTETIGGRSVTYCRVDGSLLPVDRSAPVIEIRVALPFDWNGRSMMFGGGGYNGTIPDVRANVPFGPADRPSPLERGYATYGSDSGHQADLTSHPVPSLDGSFAMNDEALRNFSAGDALKKTHDAAQFLIRQGYRAKTERTYFAGGSTGGREALAVTQRWPQAFDGVISAYPAWNNLAAVLYLGYATQSLAKPGAFPGPEKQTLLYNSVIQACDGLDGLIDKVISHPRSCHFDPRELRCPGGGDSGPACLSDRQIASIAAVSSPWAWPYKIASGEKGYPGFPFLSGADMRTPLLGFGTTAPSNPMPLTSGYGMQYWDQWVKYFLTRDPNHTPLTVDPRQPGQWLARISHLSGVQDLNNADLRPFARSGGKLLLIHGTADELVSHRSTNDYYERVADTVGPHETGEFMRYYLVPGANHANFGTPAFAASWDSLTAIEQWVERNREPAAPVVTDASNGRTRPLCQYPLWPKYRAGDPDSAKSFVCSR
ncbi:feruloyl esterase [Streptomyces camponoticapitis]|uniref:Feruloyl esterase n=1 Tax=Streptomyces camponoticapitis TaxID=1616125 RepID=A0ABQ2E8F6_9ACTN|nr:tannase/feruloyl esterase family alpha/beta hydrolase [Streptomyces camponoticapitis]GGK00561.1 feruloyl esterase [Streptomyces camponoticapitis]